MDERVQRRTALILCPEARLDYRVLVGQLTNCTGVKHVRTLAFAKSLHEESPEGYVLVPEFELCFVALCHQSVKV